MIEFSKIIIAYLVVAFLSLSLLYGLQRHLVRVGLPERLAPAAAMIAAAVIAYPTLFLYLVGRPLGFAYSLVIAVVAIVWFRPAALRLSPFLFAFACGLAYLGALHLFDTNIALDELPRKLFFETMRPDDHVLPQLYAHRVADHLASRFGPFGNGWYFTDRPPLETSFILLSYPLSRIFGMNVLYQALGTSLQVSCLASTWYLSRALRFRDSETRLCMLVLAGSGFVYYNSVYLWPKLLAAALFLAALVPFAEALVEKRRLTLVETVIAAAGCAMAMLSHGGAAYSILALAVLAAVFIGRLFTFRRVLAGFAVVVALYLPWQAYSTFVDPNTGKLLKAHLTNGDSDSPAPFTRMLVKSYGSISWHDWTRNRLANLEILAGAYYVDPVIAQLARGIVSGQARGSPDATDHDNAIDAKRLHYDWQSLASAVRIDQREHFLRALGPMALGIPVLVLLAFPTWRKRLLDIGVGAILALEIVTLVLWNIIEFNPSSDVLTHASYAMVILAFMLATVLLYRVTPWLGRSVGLASIVLSVILWLVFVPGPMIAEASFDWLAALVLIAGAITLVAIARSRPLPALD